ncbi:hypothetical protein BJ878DRAFT_528253 [Calycina marina]|uniref:Tr-type G domain-containing protein n=1 Tax=Calycina marina TaxID=1763456 RepID=A0A9P8CAM8_9HELO|nr:hypothetical protein BJ878DRAFT_528253 [Calycina marina]
MASLFTFDSDHQRVSSPWLSPSSTSDLSSSRPRQLGSGNASPSLLADHGVVRLEAEPQEGPVEYKLHLLLRSRREYSSSSTGQDRFQPYKLNEPRKEKPVSSHEKTRERRQRRLQELSTQLLWRLQQSSPYHDFSTSELTLPELPEADGSLEPPRPSKLLAGLEQSRGALYEIGVSDDGTLVGLTKDEMDESVKNLRAMAASLGCTVQLLKMVVVGSCEWHERKNHLNSPSQHQTKFEAREEGESEQNLRHHAELWVAEALVIPDLSSSRDILSGNSARDQSSIFMPDPPYEADHISDANSQGTSAQLRIALTGPTTSGKSTLLGTLSTSTLDDGRGKSRLSLLKHLHEIESGVTSSITQELIGYKDESVINYAYPHITSWTDIHSTAKHGRLVFFSDSAGHPRYRRTIVRGLIGWVPHWTLLCIAADDGENAPITQGGTASAQQILGTAGSGIDLVKAHLELCLKLNQPLTVVITKQDLASGISLKKTLSKILTAIKSAERVPFILPPDHNSSIPENGLRTLATSDNEKIQKVLDKMQESNSLVSVVPIVLTSASKGIGIRLLHCLLQSLPIPKSPTAYDFVGRALNPEQPACLFHVEDIFINQPLSHEREGSGHVMAGHMRFGRLSVGDFVSVGPFHVAGEKNGDMQENIASYTSPNSAASTMFRHSSADLTRITSRNANGPLAKSEWHAAKVVSIRNLRLPVTTLEAGQVGTIGVIFDRRTLLTQRMRKGMVIAIPSQHMTETGLQAAAGFTACFEDSNIDSVTPGSLVVVYIASIRATARVLHLTLLSDINGPMSNQAQDDDVFGLDEAEEKEHGTEPLIFGSDGITSVAFELLANREWIELGSQILVMPGGGVGLYSGSERGQKGVAGLECFVGKVIEVVD